MKLLLTIVWFSLALYANPLLDEKIKSYIGATKYETQKNLINVLFAHSEEFVKINGSVDSIKVIKVLKQNGLLKLIYDNPVHLRLAFRTMQDPIIFLKIINETLESMGYNYFLTNNALRDSTGFVWEIYLQTEHIVDPVAFAKALELRGCSVNNVINNDNHYWFYDINSENASLGAKELEFGVNTNLGKPLKPYWVRVRAIKEITISAHAGDKWFPHVVFFDENLHVISDIKSVESMKSLKVKVPSGAIYLKLSDAFMLENIKHGLAVLAKD
ncbi:MAG: hypothetical protein PHN18_03770 [Sulfurospirillaceae bacterium]|nr:hypothetical protein [Sulfurospirillaceae bacterium]MDD2825473.1 hypothetical protein [Sulfurospirillaceae bacterium]